ncbi:DUF1850 domain-containing protein [Kushneria indalinina]|uniref:DUF1850 domain-containing protein n=1 Tax=Kushneria indalinina DSM 14324 TaxID=1122140 RepID=A0A3D9DT70_9GAMM|nr:DUF1850 domain-containing protein [Kushneria indalinina]REC93936.1 hypothetical protein C8D72_2299 [Kushneria indalinina DSM 14324]
MPRRRLWLTLCALALTVALGWPRPWLVVSELTAQGEVAQRYVFPGGDGTTFSLRWQHSVEREDWIETFSLSGGDIRVVRSRFKTFGAGVPDTGHASHLERGWVVLDDIARQVDPLLVQAASREHYRMGYSGYCFDLKALGAAPLLHFQQQRLPTAAVIGALWRPWWHWLTSKGRQGPALSQREQHEQENG